MDETLLDTDILSEVMKGRNPQVAFRMKAYVATYGALTTSVFSILEIVKGHERVGRFQQLQGALIYLRAQTILNFDEISAEIAGRIMASLERSGQTIGSIDPMIAAIALRRGLTLATGNTSHYERIRDLGYALKLEDWRI